MVALLNKCYFFVFIFILCNCKINSVGRKKTKSTSKRTINQFVKSNGSNVIANFYENNNAQNSLDTVNNNPMWTNTNTNAHFIDKIVELSEKDLKSIKSSFEKMYNNIFRQYELVWEKIVGIYDYIQNQDIKENYPGDVLKVVNDCFNSVKESVENVLKECENNLRNKEEKSVEFISTEDFLKERISECKFLNEANTALEKILVNIINEFTKLNSFFCEINKENKEISDVNDKCKKLNNFFFFNIISFNQCFESFNDKFESLPNNSVEVSELFRHFLKCQDIENIIKEREEEVKDIQNRSTAFSTKLVSFENNFVSYNNDEREFAKKTDKSSELCEKYVSKKREFKCNVNNLQKYKDVVSNLIEKYKEFLNEMTDTKDKSFKKGIMQKYKDSKNKFKFVKNTIKYFYDIKNSIASGMEVMRKNMINYYDGVLKSKDDNAIIKKYKNLESEINRFGLNEKNLKDTDLEKLNGIKNEYAEFFDKELNDIATILYKKAAKISEIEYYYGKIKNFLERIIIIKDDKVKYNLGETKKGKQNLVDFLTENEYEEFEVLQQFMDSVYKLEKFCSVKNAEFENKIKKLAEKENKKDNGKKIEKKTKKNKEIQDFKKSKEYLEFKKELDNNAKIIFNQFHEKIGGKINNLDVIQNIRKELNIGELISNRINYDVIIKIKDECLKQYEKKLEMYKAINEFSISYGRYINSSKEIEGINGYIEKQGGYFQRVLSCVNDVNEEHCKLKKQINSYIKKCKRECDKYEQDREGIETLLGKKKDLCKIICKKKKENIDDIFKKCEDYYKDNVSEYFSEVEQSKKTFDDSCKTYKEGFFKYYDGEIYKLKKIFLGKVNNDTFIINSNSSFKKLGDIEIENGDNIDYKFEKNLNLVNVAFEHYKRQFKKNAKLGFDDFNIDQHYNNEGSKVEYNNISEKKEYFEEQSNNNVNSIQVELQNNNDENPTQWDSEVEFDKYKKAVDTKKIELAKKCCEFVQRIDIFLNHIYGLKYEYEKIDYLINVLSKEDENQKNDNKKENKNNSANDVKGIEENIDKINNASQEINSKKSIFGVIVEECNSINRKLDKLNGYKNDVRNIDRLELYEEFSRIMGKYNGKNLWNKGNKQFNKGKKQINKGLIDDEQGINNIKFENIFNNLRGIYNEKNNNHDEYKIINGLNIDFYVKLKSTLKVIFEEKKLLINAQEEDKKSNISEDEEGFIEIKNYYTAYIEFYNNFAKEICKIFYSKDDNLLLNNIIKDLIGKIDKYNNLKKRLETYLDGGIYNKNKNKALVLILEKGQHDVHYTEGAVIFLFDEFLKLCVDINKDLKFIKYLIKNFIKVFEQRDNFDGLNDIIGDTDGVFEKLVEINKNLSTLSQKICEAPEDKFVIDLDFVAQQKEMTKDELIKNIKFIYEYIVNKINMYFTDKIVLKFKECTKEELKSVSNMFKNVSSWYSYNVLEKNYKNLRKIYSTCNLLYCGKCDVDTNIMKGKKSSNEDIIKKYKINEENCILSLFDKINDITNVKGVCEGYDNSKKDKEHIEKCEIHRLSLFIRMWMEKYKEAVKYFDEDENIGSLWKIDRVYEMEDCDHRNVELNRFKLFNGGDLISKNKKYGYFYGCKKIYDTLESISCTLKILNDENGGNEINENLEESNENLEEINENLEEDNKLSVSDDKGSYKSSGLLNLINECRSDYEKKIHLIEKISYNLVERYTKNFDKNKNEKVNYDKNLILFIQVKFIKFLQVLYSKKISDEIGNINDIITIYNELFNDAREGERQNVLYGSNNKIDKIIAAVIILKDFENSENVGKENVVNELCNNICNVLSAETIKGLNNKIGKLKSEFAAVESIYNNGDNKDNKYNENVVIDEELESELKKYFVLNKINSIYNNLSKEIIGGANLADEFKLYYENCIKLEKNNDKNDLYNILNNIIDNNIGDKNIKNNDVQKNAIMNVLKKNVKNDLPERYNVVLENKEGKLDSFLEQIKNIFEKHKKSFSEISENLKNLEVAYYQIVEINNLYETSSKIIQEINGYLQKDVLGIDFSKEQKYAEKFNKLIEMFSKLVNEVKKIKKYIKEKPKNSGNINGGAQENIMNANMVLGNKKGKNLKNQNNVGKKSSDVNVFGYNVTECISTYAQNVINKLNKELFVEQNKGGNGLDLDLLKKGPNLMKNLPFENNNLPQNNNENNNLKNANVEYFNDVMSKVNEKLKAARLENIKDVDGYIDYLVRKENLLNFEKEINYFKNLCGAISKILGGIFDTSSIESTKVLFDNTINDLAIKIKSAKDEYINDVISLKEDEIKNIAGDCIIKNKNAIKAKLVGIASICKDENIFNNEEVNKKIKEIEVFLKIGFKGALEGKFKKNIQQEDQDKFIQKKGAEQSVIEENLYFDQDAILKSEVGRCLEKCKFLSSIIRVLIYLGIDKDKIYACILNFFSGNGLSDECKLCHIFSQLITIGVPKKGFIDIFGKDFNKLEINCDVARDKVLKITNFKEKIGPDYLEFFRYDVSYHNAEFSKWFIKNILDEKEGFLYEVVEIYKNVVESYKPFRQLTFNKLKEECAKVYKNIFCVGNQQHDMSLEKFINFLKEISGIDFSSQEVKSADEFSSSLKNIEITNNEHFLNMYPMIQQLKYDISRYYIGRHQNIWDPKNK